MIMESVKLNDSFFSYSDNKMYLIYFKITNAREMELIKTMSVTWRRFMLTSCLISTKLGDMSYGDSKINYHNDIAVSQMKYKYI